MPKVSICIPAYDQPELLRKALETLLVQDFQDYEVVISDDSKGTKVKELLDTFSFGGKLRYFHNDPGHGSPGNWNFAVQQANAEYIKILHHDDYFTSPSSLRSFVEMLDNNPSAILAFSATEVDITGLGMKKVHSCSLANFKKLAAQPERLFFYNYIGAPSATIVRKTGLLFDVNMKWLVDIDWYMRHIAKGGIVHTRETLICTVHGSEGQITQMVQNERNIQVREHVYLFDKIYHERLDLKKFSLLFQVLFNRFAITGKEELNVIYPLPGKLDHFFSEVFGNMKSAAKLKKIRYLLGKRTFNDHLFTFKSLFR